MAAEINSSFHRPHRAATYARWAASVPAAFQFSVKLPREITHKRKLAEPAGPLDQFCAEIQGLGPRLGPVLIQLPPSLAFDPAIAEAFFGTLREKVAGDLVCEPRHATWFEADAGALLCKHRVAQVAADPALVPEAAEPGALAGPGLLPPARLAADVLLGLRAGLAGPARRGTRPPCGSRLVHVRQHCERGGDRQFARPGRAAKPDLTRRVRGRIADSAVDRPFHGCPRDRRRCPRATTARPGFWSGCGRADRIMHRRKFSGSSIKNELVPTLRIELRTADYSGNFRLVTLSRRPPQLRHYSPSLAR